MTEGCATKTAAGRFFEDFRIGETIRHATPRTLSDGDASLYSGLYRHVAPLFAGDTVFAWSEVVETAALPARDDVGALRLRTVATKNRPCADFPLREGEGYEPHVVLELDYWALAPRRA
jgi:acyl dehydratase